MFNNTSVVTRNNRVVSKILESPAQTVITSKNQGVETLIINPDNSQIKVINEVGTKIWSLLDGNRSIDDIAIMLASEYDVDIEEAREDTKLFLQELKLSGLVDEFLK
jgi:hypothetical protein